MKPRKYPLTKYENSRDVTIKNVTYETAGVVTERGFIYVSNDPEIVGKKVIILVEDEQGEKEIEKHG
jgi:hypothetical protein